MSRPRTPIGTFGSIRVTKIGSGRHLAYTRYRDKDGKLRPVKASGLTREAAIRELKSRIAARNGAPGDGELSIASPFPELAARWIESVNASTTLEQSTKELYVWNMEHYVLPPLRDFALGELTVARCERFLQAQAAVSRNRALQSRRTLSLALGMAARFGAIPANPVKECSRLKRSAGRPDALSVEEVRTIRQYVRDWRAGTGLPGPPPDGQLAVVIDMMVATSGRINEVLAIRRQDVTFTDDERAVVHLCGTLTYPKGAAPYRKDHPKTATSDRFVTIPRWAACSLRERWPNVGQEGDTLVFTSRNGTPLRDCNIRRLLRQIVEATGLDPVSPHKFRRTAGTIVARADGEELASKLLGHSSVQITREHYIEPVQQVDARTADILEIVAADPATRRTVT